VFVAEYGILAGGRARKTIYLAQVGQILPCVRGILFDSGGQMKQNVRLKKQKMRKRRAVAGVKRSSSRAQA